MGISAIVITLNEEKNIRECLETLKWCDEIIMVDSGSTDSTVKIAEEFTKKIILTDNLPYGEKKNIGIDNAVNDWVLWLDADERITKELKDEIQQKIKGVSINAFYINRKSFFINKFIKHCGWYPDYTLRLFRKDTNIRFDASLVHEKANFSGVTVKLSNEILHFTDPDFEHYINKLNNYTSLSAEELGKKGKKASILDIIFRPVFTFFKMYFLKLGILDGYTGLVLCTLSSIHVFSKYSKLYLMNKSNSIN